MRISCIFRATCIGSGVHAPRTLHCDSGSSSGSSNSIDASDSSYFTALFYPIYYVIIEANALRTTQTHGKERYAVFACISPSFALFGLSPSRIAHIGPAQFKCQCMINISCLHRTPILMSIDNAKSHRRTFYARRVSRSIP